MPAESKSAYGVSFRVQMGYSSSMDNEANANPDQPTDAEILWKIQQATDRRQAQLDELEILSRHLVDPEGNPL